MAQPPKTPVPWTGLRAPIAFPPTGHGHVGSHRGNLNKGTHLLTGWGLSPYPTGEGPPCTHEAF